MTLDAIVLGLGVMGSAALHRMAKAGLRVAGIDRFDVPNAMGSSHGGTRVTRKAYFEDARYVPLLERSWALVAEMEKERGETLLLRTGGLYFGAAESAGVRASLEAARRHGLAHEWLDASAIRRRFPMFAPEDGEAGVFEDDAGILFAEKLVTAQIELALAAGASVHARERATHVELGAGGVRVTTDRGAHHAERLVVALGPWWNEPLEGLPPLAIPLRVERQVQLWLAPRAPELFAPERMPVFLRFGEPTAFYGLPRAVWPGVKICRHHGGETTRPDALDRDLRESDEAAVRAFVRRTMPLADGPLLGARVCMYTNTPDENFVVGVHPAHARVLVMAGFSGHGFKLAPAMGELVAELATRGATELDASLFDPSREMDTPAE
ncbi:MAG: N-methyl-L-tryptophan oxidase [Sandaracinus sp.]